MGTHVLPWSPERKVTPRCPVSLNTKTRINFIRVNKRVWFVHDQFSDDVQFIRTQICFCKTFQFIDEVPNLFLQDLSIYRWSPFVYFTFRDTFYHIHYTSTKILDRSFNPLLNYVHIYPTEISKNKNIHKIYWFYIILWLWDTEKWWTSIQKERIVETFYLCIYSKIIFFFFLFFTNTPTVEVKSYPT